MACAGGSGGAWFFREVHERHRARAALGIEREQGGQRRWFGAGLLDGFGARWGGGRLEDGRQDDAEEAGERAQGAGGRGAGVRRGGGEDGEGFRLVQEVLELGGVAGGAVAELGDQPEFAARQVWRGRAAFLAQAGRAGQVKRQTSRDNHRRQAPWYVPGTRQVRARTAFDMPLACTSRQTCATSLNAKSLRADGCGS